jgi:RNA polymerase sigma-70 factor (ECF subfamily)
MPVPKGIDVVRAGEDERAGSSDRFRALAARELRVCTDGPQLCGDEAEMRFRTACSARTAAFRGWSTSGRPERLTAILVNCCHDHQRSRARRPEPVDMDDVDEFSLYKRIADEDPFPYSDSLHLDFLEQFGREDVRAVLRSLPLLYRTPLVLVHMEGYRVKEVASMLDTPLGTMLARLHRGRKLFERELWRYADEHGLLREGARP